MQMSFSIKFCGMSSISVWYYEILWNFCQSPNLVLTYCMRVDRGGIDPRLHSVLMNEGCHQTHHSNFSVRGCFSQTLGCLSSRQRGRWHTRIPHLGTKVCQKREMNLRAKIHSFLSICTHGGMLSKVVRSIMSYRMMVFLCSSVSGLEASDLKF